MGIFGPDPVEHSRLSRYRLLAPSASVRVSPLCLGAMSLGDKWSSFLGEMNKETAFKIMDFYFEKGGNFIDTANNYHGGQTEEWMGEWMDKKGNRDQLVLATKYSGLYLTEEGPHPHIRANFTGNSKKSMHLSVRDSLRKLRTDYIDILYVHWYDGTTSVEEIMNALHILVAKGSVLYLGASDMPAWFVAKCNQYARDHALTPFTVYQGKWNLALRDFEMEILPLCRADGMGVAPWGAVGQGNFKSQAQRKADEESKEKGRNFGPPPSELEKAASKALESVAAKHKTEITSVALAYVMQKAPYVFPIVGGRKISHLQANIDALSINLSSQDIKALEDACPLHATFPHSAFGLDPPYDAGVVSSTGIYDFVDHLAPIKPSK